MKLFLSSLFLFSAVLAYSQYTLVWSDEFSTPGLDNTKWVHETGGHGWGNNESQYYTTNAANLNVSNDVLTITALEETIGNNDYTSAKIVTKDLNEVKFGKIEARIKCPMGQGIWPAFWMLGENINQVSWPQCGEIDVMEHINNETTTHGTAHWNNGGHVYQGTPVMNTPAEYHVYSVIWDETKIQWLLDGSIYYGLNIENGVNSTSEFQLPFYLILNLAVGGNWPGYPDATTVFPAELKVDYVRIYKHQDELSIKEQSLTSIEVSPNPANEMITFSNLSSTEAVNVVISNVHGKVSMIDKVSNLSNTIDISGLEKGVYFIQIEGQSRTKKLIKN